MLHMFAIVFKCFCKCFKRIFQIFYLFFLYIASAYFKIDCAWETTGDEGDVRAHCRVTRSQARALGRPDAGKYWNETTRSGYSKAL
jgi:hypothetical protein